MMEAVGEFTKGQPFLMVSYAHKNSNTVRPVIRRLREYGVNTWFDDNIVPRKFWDDEIALHIQQCEILLCFLSKEYLASDNCKEELNYAKQKNKAILPIFITDVQLPPGLAMRIATRQAVHMNQFKDTDALIAHLFHCEEIERCRNLPAASPVISRTKKVLNMFRPANWSFRQLNFRYFRKSSIAVSIVLFILLAFLLIFIPDNVQLYEDLSVSVNETDLVISGRSVDSDILGKLHKLESLTSLTFQQCDFSPFTSLSMNFPESVQHLSFEQCGGFSLHFAARHSNLVTLEAVDCAITNSDLPGRMPVGLKNLSLSGNPSLSDLSCLTGCTQLVSLDISGTSVSSLDSIPSSTIESLDFSNSNISTLEPLSGWEKLTTIRGNNTPIISITPLAQLKNLVEIEFRGCALLGPAEPFLSLRLEKLYLSNNNINQLDAFKNCTILSDVDVSDNVLRDVSILAKSSSRLKKLNLSGNPLPQEHLQGLLRSCNELIELNLDRIIMETLPVLSHMHKLKWLSASGCGLTTISKLNDLISKYELKYLCLSNNYIRDIELLYTRNRVQDITMDLGMNPIDTLIFLPNGHYECLVLVDNSFDANHWVKSIEGKTLVISAGDEITGKIAKENFEHIYIMDCPLDERVRVEDYYGTNRVTFLENEDELISCMDQLGFNYHFLKGHTQ